ncbi:envelope stress response activation lipoprotein NlpE [Buttiauxella warmboldiae]|uniref:Envelope stress response activation lipoprotein NlpE n=1 Tax=Buttiauxella warmboldiae TaxID=82993 RepID=A0A3N5D9N7_9ENTR|nr:envelope stress response activation lipoprotein NlpE [Buttiauxella warmboldiae]RPH25058.1 envelope stress response activation lipoprotein NlpE [Buttiauxella warmboldiae]
MKKILLSAIGAFSLFALFGCNNRAEVQTLQPTQAAELQPMQQSYRGVLPCADCSGIETSLFLEKDGSWVMNRRYEGAKEPAVFASYGSWARTADKLVLTESNGEKLYFRPKGDDLEMLDRSGNSIESQLNYTLKPMKAALPATPMAMKGMYKYMADAAIFQDCSTGKTFAVASNAELERGYAAARGEDYQPVLLVVDAHFALQASPDSGEMKKTVVADRVAKFEPKKSCQD